MDETPTYTAGIVIGAILMLFLIEVAFRGTSS